MHLDNFISLVRSSLSRVLKGEKIMKTNHKYISYRQDKGTYIISMPVNGKKTYITCHSLDEALKQRESLIKLDKSVVGYLSRHKNSKEIPSLDEAFTEFMEKEIRPRVALSTYSKYTLCKNNFCKYFGDIKIDRISYDAWQEVFSSRQEKKGYARSYLIDDYRRFKAMYSYFVSKGVISSNPLDTPLKLKQTIKAKRRAFTEEEKELFLSSAKEYNQEWYIIFSLYFATGARRGEIIALRWEDIDTRNKLIHIRRNVGRGTIDGKFTELVGNTKTIGSVRDIPISDNMVQSILSLHNSKCSPSDYVFKPVHHMKYDHLSLNGIQRAFRIIAKRANLDKCLSIHCIRHYVASKLITSGVDLSTIQEIGGWKSPSVLLSTYAHSNEEAKRKALEKTLF